MARGIRIFVVAAVVLAALYGVGRIWLGRPVAHDRYSATADGAIEFVPARCQLNKIGLGCRPRLLRLYGIDMFEPEQTCRDAHGREWPCAAAAEDRLKALVAAPDFACQLDYNYYDNDGRQFASCTANGQDVGEILVREGLAFAYGRALEYLPFEAEARSKRRGAWAGQFVRPQYYRQGARLPRTVAPGETGKHSGGDKSGKTESD
ncbi:MAG: thermonuclease family protein [Alphaproteobacteria bacterium]|nr:thermonuclease family protein [Alphaproteobacteria bacterium]